jgi:hypothetical protein
MHNDNGTVVADQIYDPAFLTSVPATFTTLDWPSSSWGFSYYYGGRCPNGNCAGGPNGLGLYNTFYVEKTFRFPQAGAFPYDTSRQFTPGDFWLRNCDCIGTLSLPVFTEIDFYEFNANGNTGTIHSLIGTGDGFNAANVDISQYHTWADMITQNGSDIWVCAYLDGVLIPSGQTENGSANGCFHFYPTYRNDKKDTGPAHEIVNWVANNGCGDLNHPGCVQGIIHEYIKSIRVFSCVGYWNGPCTGSQYPLVTSSIDTGTRFAWLGRLREWIIGTAHAGEIAAIDYFNFPPGGEWVCPDGRRTTHDIRCQPKELTGPFWEACVPGRTDCIQSDTAFLGWNLIGFPNVRRGPGMCYKEQPYTCSPDGKLPQ